MSTNFRSTSLTSKPDNRHSLTPASSLSSVASSKSSDLSSASSRSCSSTNLNYIPANKNNVKLLGNKKQKATVKIKSSMVVNPVISHHHHTNPHQNNHNDHHHIISNRLTRSNSNDHINPLRFVAHNCLVKCMCLGQTSGEVFASVGNDNQVKLWAIGNTQSLVTLKGRTAIECVQFSRNEEVLATGSLKGSVQIWDLNSKSLFRTFKGHTSTIKCIDFFPSGDFLTSGSSDCTVKLWDSRKSDCVHTYDEHEKSVLCQVFSPDGKWIASGDSDGNIKIWDLTACKKITDLKAHTGAITDIKFHPMVLILVTSSMDGTICFWDLEKFKLIGRISANSGNSSSASSGYISSSCSSNRSSNLSSGKSNEIASVNSLNNAIHKVMFHPNGYQLFGIAKDKYLLCDILNEPELNCLVNMNFGIGRDIAFNKTGIVVSGHQQTYISLNLIKWRDLDNFNNYNRHNSANSTSSRRNFDHEQLHQTYLQLELISSKYGDDLKSDIDDNEILKEINFLPNENVDDRKIFSPKRELTRTPPKSDFETDFMNSANDKTFLIESKTIEQFQKQLINQKNKNHFNQPIKLPVLQNCVQPQPHVLQPQNNQNLTQMPSSNNINSSHNKLITQTNSTQNRLRNVPKSLSLRNLNKISVVQPVQSKMHQNSLSNNKPESNHNIYNSKNNFGKITPAAVVYPDSHHPLSNNSMSISNLSSNLNYNENLKEINLENSINKLVPSNCNLQLNSINHANNLSLSLGNLSRNSNTMLNISSMDLNENQILDEIYHGHQEMEIILNQREISLKFALNTWRNDTNKGFTFANSTQDMTIVAELVKLTIYKQEWNIQKCQAILPQVDNLLRSKQEVCVDAASQALEFIMENFLDLIRQNIAKHPSIGVDISREERCKKSMDCYTQLVSMRAFINKQQCMVGQLGIKFRHLSSLMERIDAKT